MSDIGQAIQVTPNIDIDWAELGRVLAEEASQRQAEFLMGFYEAVADVQLAYIGDEAIYGRDRSDVAQVFENLAFFIRDGGQR